MASKTSNGMTYWLWLIGKNDSRYVHRDGFLPGLAPEASDKGGGERGAA